MIAWCCNKAGINNRQRKCLWLQAARRFGITNTLGALASMRVFIVLALFCNVRKVANLVRGRAYLHEGEEEN